MKICAWCAIYGKHPVSLCWRPDNEVGSKDINGAWICDACTKAWKEGRKIQAEEARRHRLRGNGEV